jgi:uncharacterized alpha-E superfamily protein
MLSRVADSLYWMSRYLERAENTVRLLDVTMSLMLDAGGSNVEVRWQRMVAALGKPVEMEWNGSIEEMAQKLVYDNLSPASVIYCLNGARENARQVREEISTEMWQRLNRLYHQMHLPRAQSQFSANISDQLSTVIDGIYLFKGTTDTSMIHGQGWQFIRLGRYLERAYATATLLEVYQSELFPAQERESSGYLHLELVGLCVVARHSRPTARSTRLISRRSACSSSWCSTATFPTPSITASQARARPSRAFSKPAAGGRPRS